MVHSDTDACGTGRGCGALHEFCSSDDWKTRLSGFAGAFECVTGAGPPPAGPPALGAAATFRGTDAAAAAIDGIAAFALDSNGPCAPFLRGAVADRVVSTPSPHGDFFLVDLLQSGTFTGRARVAADGTFLGVAVSGVEHAILTAAEIALIVANDLAAQPPFDDSGGDARSPRFARGPRVTGPFWRACLESPSPYYPLYEIEALDVAGRPRTMYADFQGRQYTVLHWFNVPPPASSPVVRKDRRGNYE
jgi:hypothetical protein